MRWFAVKTDIEGFSVLIGFNIKQLINPRDVNL